MLELARAAGFKVSERRYTREEAYRAEGAFLTSSTRRVVPISQIDGHVLNEGVISDGVKRVKALYDEYVSEIAHSIALDSS